MHVGCRATRGALAVLLLVLAACGDDGADGSGDAPPESPPAGVAAARERIKRFEALPSFKPPGPAFDAAGLLRGKTIYEIPLTSEVPFVAAVENGMERAAAEVGAELVAYPNQGEPTQWAQGIATAITQGADAITLLAQDPQLLGPQIERAERAGIPVIVLRTTGEGEPCQADPSGEPYGTTCVPGPFEEAGRLEADWVIAETGGDADVLVITSRDARSTIPLLQGLEGEFAENCPACELTFIDVPIPEWANRLRTEVQSALVANPDIAYVIPIYDSMSQFVVPALAASRAADRVRIATFNGTPFVLEMIQDDDVVASDVGENLDWIGWAAMDQVFRVLAGEEPVPSEHTPLRVFHDGHVDEAGRPPETDRGYGDAYVDGYRRLWGVES
jgi:ribose transport system substrate-binding protein